MVIVKYVYDAYGNILDISGDKNLGHINPFRFKSYYFDEESNFYYLNSRYYDPEIGRFINADTIDVLNIEQGNSAQYNLFVYCLNNPIMFGDESGYSAATVLLGLASLVLGLICMGPMISSFKLAISIGIGLVLSALTLIEYNKAMKTLEKTYGKYSTKYKQAKVVNDAILTLSLFSCALTVILSIVGFKYIKKEAIWYIITSVYSFALSVCSWTIDVAVWSKTWRPLELKYINR